MLAGALPEVVNNCTSVSTKVTAMEVWLLVCMVLVLLTLVQYAVILRQIVLYKR